MHKVLLLVAAAAVLTAVCGHGAAAQRHYGGGTIAAFRGHAVPGRLRYPRRPARAASGRATPHEVLVELPSSTRPQSIHALQRRHRLSPIDAQTSRLSGRTIYRLRIPDHRPVGAVVRSLRADKIVTSAQPNYRYAPAQNAPHGRGWRMR